MKKAYNPEEEDINNTAYIVKVSISFIVIVLLIAFTIFMGIQYMQQRKLKSLEQDIVSLAKSSQSYVDLQKKFDSKLDTEKYGNKYITPILPSSFQGANITHPLGGNTVIGRSEMSGNKDSELFITLRDVPTKNKCIELVNLLDNEFPVIAVGENDEKNFGINTGMFVKSNYSNRNLSPQHLELTCLNYSQKTGKVNITVWITADTKFINKNLSE